MEKRDLYDKNRKPTGETIYMFLINHAEEAYRAIEILKSKGRLK